MSKRSKPFKFTFRFVNDKGEPGILTRRGRFDGGALKLAKEQVPVELLANVDLRLGNLVIVFRDGRAPVVLGGIPQKKAGRLRRELLVASSSHWAVLHQEELEAAGRGDEFRISVCSSCEATIDLSGIAEAPQVCCPYCETITTVDGDGPLRESEFRHCEQCGYYARPKEFTIGYFIFALYFFLWSFKRQRTCHVCIRREVWKMLAANMIFLVLLPVAIVQVIRAYRGGSRRSPQLRDLDRANALARKRRLHEATATYEEICAHLPAAAGVHFNHALALLGAGDRSSAAAQLTRALEECPNYERARAALKLCQTGTAADHPTDHHRGSEDAPGVEGAVEEAESRQLVGAV